LKKNRYDSTNCHITSSVHA